MALRLETEKITRDFATQMQGAVKFNVGGRVFETTRQTLAPATFFDGFFDERFGRVDFIDRDSVGFEHVLAWLRDPQYPFPPERTYELDFYGIEWRRGTEDEPPKQPHPADTITAEMLFGSRPDDDCEFPTNDNVSMGTLVALVARPIAEDASPSRTQTRFFEYFRPVAPAERSAVGIQTLSGTTVERRGDCLRRLWLQVWTRGPNPPNRHELFEKLTLRIGDGVSIPLCKDLFLLLELVEKPRSLRDYDAAEDLRTGSVCLGLPFWFSNVFGRDDEYPRDASLPLLSLPFAEVSVYPEWSKDEAIEEAKLVAEYVYLDTKERGVLTLDAIYSPGFSWSEESAEYEPGSSTAATLSLGGWDSGDYDRFLFAFRTDPGQFLPIRHFGISLNGSPFCDLSTRMISEQMASLGYFPDRAVYVYRVEGSSLSLGRIPNVRVTIQLYPGYPRGRILLFGRAQKTMIYSAGGAAWRR